MTLTKAEESGVRSTLEAYAAAYSKKDLRGMLAIFSPGIRGFGSGPDEIVKDHDDLIRQLRRDMGQAESISVTFSDMLVNGQMPVAWAMTNTEIAFAIAGSPAQVLHGRSTMVLRNTGSRWLIEQFHFAMPYTGQSEGQSFPGA